MRIDLKREISLPRLRGGSPPKLPKPLADLYVDLRDRHLLPVVAFLLVAIVAAPILLGGGGEKKHGARPAVASASGTGEVTDSSFTVVPAGRDLRSPARRLGHRRPLDPFRPLAGGGGAKITAAEVEAALESAVSAEAQSSPPAGSAASEPAPPAQPAVESGSGGAPPPATPEAPAKVIVEHEVVDDAVDMKVGFLPGELQERTEVAPMTKLPNPKHPVLLFVGLSKDDAGAMFLMTSQVTAYYGAVHCALDKHACQLVELKPGKSASFTYGYGADATRYKVFLKKIEPVVEAQGRGKAGAAAGEHPHPRGVRQPNGVASARHFSK